MLEGAADVAVQPQNILAGDALAVWWVCHHDGRRCWLLHVAYILLGHLHDAIDTRRLHIFLRNGHSLTVDVVTIDAMREFALL